MSRIGIIVVAPSSPVPQIELKIGVDALKEAGFRVKVHPQTRKKGLFLAGNDEERANAFWEAAHDSEAQVIWCARGGFGANRLLPILERMTRLRGVPEERLLVGYSDITALINFTQTRWGWRGLHGPMPASRPFSVMPLKDWARLTDWVKQGEGAQDFQPGARPVYKTKVWNKPRSSIEGNLCGGNLTVWNALSGTPFMPKGIDRVLFFEDVAESPGRLDRSLTQLHQSGGFEGVKAIILGDFTDCGDRAPMGLTAVPKSKSALLSAKKLKPIRALVSDGRALKEVFAEWGRRLEIPVFAGIPVGHGPGQGSLPMGARVRIDLKGALYVSHWGWAPKPRP